MEWALAGRMLVVDDDPALRTLVRTAMELEGWAVEEAADGTEAVDRLAILPEFDVVLLDVLMPGRSGLEVLRHLREHPPAGSPKFVVVSAKSDPMTRRSAERLDAADYVTKPFDMDDLVNRCLQLRSETTALDESGYSG